MLVGFLQGVHDIIQNPIANTCERHLGGGVVVKTRVSRDMSVDSKGDL